VDYATVADSLVGLIISKIWDVATGDVVNTANPGSLFNLGAPGPDKNYTLIPNLANVASYFSGTALDVYDNVIDTMCLADPTAAETGE
jgi:hypothetical protein